jgi:hypothetical protein
MMETDSKLTLINDKELMALFNELTPKVRDKIVNTGLKNAARLIISEAKRNFKTTKKNKSKTGYRDFNSTFKVKEMKSKPGVIAGMQHREGYKYRFLNYGTDTRNYKTKSGKIHNTGKIEPTNFFTYAVESKKQTAEKDIQEAITKSMNRTVEKYNKKYTM